MQISPTAMTYSAESRSWFLRDAYDRYELELGGTPEQPDLDGLVIAQEMLPHIEELAPKGIELLDGFLDYSKFEEEGEWYVDGMLCGTPPLEGTRQFGIFLNHVGDPYGSWISIFRAMEPHERDILKARAWPIGFYRKGE